MEMVINNFGKGGFQRKNLRTNLENVISRAVMMKATFSEISVALFTASISFICLSFSRDNA